MKKILAPLIAAVALGAPQTASAQDVVRHDCEETSGKVQANCHYGTNTCYAWTYAEWKDPLLPPSTAVCVNIDKLTT